MKMKNLLKQYVIEEIKKIREVDVSDGTKTPRGSLKHVKDLEKRIADLRLWRDKERKGSEHRAHYTRIIQKLQYELKSAQRAKDKV